MNLPVTRYYGSKRKVVEKIGDVLQKQDIQFDSFLDLFGGSGIVSYYMQAQGKQVIYNDILASNCQIAKALLGSPKGVFSANDALALLHRQDSIEYDNVIEENFSGIYYTDEENRQIDIVIQNIERLPEQQKASAYYVLFQSCLIKRPFNIFHRANLNLRTNFHTANFGNKVTWEQPFELLFEKFANELNSYQFANPQRIAISCSSALHCTQTADLCYIDTPYFNKASNHVTYHARYHFIEGLMNYPFIRMHMNMDKRNKELDFNQCAEFEQAVNFENDLRALFAKYHDSILVMSYTSKGYPSIDRLEEIMSGYKANVQVIALGSHPFALNRSNENREEVIIIGQ